MKNRATKVVELPGAGAGSEANSKPPDGSAGPQKPWGEETSAEEARRRAEARQRRLERLEAIDPEDLPEVISVDEVAALLRLNRKTIYEQFKAGKIPGGRRVGNAIRFHRDTVLSWLAKGKSRASRSSRRVR